MDEPLSNLDAKLRVQMRSEISRIQSDLDVTTVYVTHDQVEAMTMGDRVAVMRKGELQQVGSPPDLFSNPKNLFVAGFIGSPSMNFAMATVEKSNGGYSIKLGDQSVKVDQKVFEKRPALEGYAGKEIILGIRPQDFEDASLAETPEGSRLKVKIDLVERIGTETLVHFQVDAPVALTEDMKELAADVGSEEQQLERKAKEGTNDFVGTLNPKTQVSEGENAELSVDTTQLHFFDPEGSAGIYDQK